MKIEGQDALAVARNLVEGLSDPAILLDPELQPVVFNNRYAELSGMRSRELDSLLKSGTQAFQLLAVDADEDRANALTAVSTGRSMHLAEVTARNRNNQEFTVYLSFLPLLDSDGSVLGVIELFRDVSDEARLQERYRELLALERARAEDLERIVEDRTRELTAALEEVTRLSRHDALTGLLNRRAFTEYATQALDLASRHERTVGFLLGDLDHFKKLNDTLGHQAGDVLLVEAAKALCDAVRTSDRVARFGGEEFIVLLTETSALGVLDVAERCRAAVGNLPMDQLVPGAKSPTISIGIALYPDHGSHLEELIASADQALYRAKDRGRNRVMMYEPGSKPVEAAKPAADVKKVLVVGSSDDGMRQELESLGEGYEVIICEGTEQGVATCRQLEVDVVVAAQTRPADSIDFLRACLREVPAALRVMLIDSKELFVEVRGTNMARVDCFVLRDEISGTLRTVLEDGLTRRDLDHHRLLTDSQRVRRSFQARVDEIEEIVSGELLDFAYQPIVDPRTREVHAYEALCRPRHPTIKQPDYLFEAALKTGNIWRLGRLVRRIALGHAEGKLPDGSKIFINLHPAEIDDAELLNVSSQHLDPSRIVFEVTERAAIPDLKRFCDTTSKLTGRGYQVAIDDLGAGYASLNAVALLGPSYVKLDMTMIRGLEGGSRIARLVGRMVDYANDVGIHIVAEGIETEEEAQAVIDLGCHYAQGYYFARPGPLPE